MPVVGEDRVTREVDLPGGSYPYLVVARRLANGGAVQGVIYLRRFVRNARDVRDIYLWALPLPCSSRSALGNLARARQPAADRRDHPHGAPHLGHATSTRRSRPPARATSSTSSRHAERDGRPHPPQRGAHAALLANAAHELRTPLNALRSQLEVTLEQARTPEEYRKALGETAEQVASLSEAVHAMLRLAQSEAGLPAEHRVPVARRDLVREVVEFFEPLADRAGPRAAARARSPKRPSRRAGWLHQCFANLIDNAIRYTPEGGRIEVAVVVEIAGRRRGRARRASPTTGSASSGGARAHLRALPPRARRRRRARARARASASRSRARSRARTAAT